MEQEKNRPQETTSENIGKSRQDAENLKQGQTRTFQGDGPTQERTTQKQAREDLNLDQSEDVAQERTREGGE